MHVRHSCEFEMQVCHRIGKDWKSFYLQLWIYDVVVDVVELFEWKSLRNFVKVYVTVFLFFFLITVNNLCRYASFIFVPRIKPNNPQKWKHFRAKYSSDCIASYKVNSRIITSVQFLKIFYLNIKITKSAVFNSISFYVFLFSVSAYLFFLFISQFDYNIPFLLLSFPPSVLFIGVISCSIGRERKSLEIFGKCYISKSIISCYLFRNC